MLSDGTAICLGDFRSRRLRLTLGDALAAARSMKAASVPFSREPLFFCVKAESKEEEEAAEEEEYPNGGPV
jgi:hypothetical protein